MVNVNRASAPFGFDLRDVFTYESFPNRLRPLGLSLGQLSTACHKGIESPPKMRTWGGFRVL